MQSFLASLSRKRSALVCLVCAFALIGVTGCGSNMSATAGKLTVVDSSGNAIDSLAITGTANVALTTSGDAQNAGVDWTVTCQGNPVTGSRTGGACGTLSSAHTANGTASVFTAPAAIPVGNTVTITAALTANSSQSKSVTLTIVSKSIAVAIQNSNISQYAGGTVSLIATTTYDSTGAGVTWSANCGSSDCGSFGAGTTSYTNATTYTETATYTAPTIAPTGGTVTITATSAADKTRSASVTATIKTAPTTGLGPISLSLSPTTFYSKTAGSTKLTATLANDTNNKGVDWTLQCAAGSSCGQLSATHTAGGVAVTYVAPSSVPTNNTVTVTATSTADTTQTASSVGTILTTAPIAVTLSSGPGATMSIGAQATLNATVANDASTAGVDWSASCGTAGNCGTFSLIPAHTASGGSITYTAPYVIPTGSTVTIMAASSSSSPSNPATAKTTIVSASPTVTFVQQPPTSLAGTAQAMVSATVTNDPTSAGIRWTLECGSTTAGACGSITPYTTANGEPATYTAPPVTATGTAVTIKATSIASTTASTTSTTSIIPATGLSTNFVPAVPAQVQTGAMVNLKAAVTNDSAQAGVDWQVCASGCGFFTTKPAKDAIPATSTTPYVPAVPATIATTVTGWPNGLPLPYTAPTDAPTSGSVQVVIAAHANTGATNSALMTITSEGTGPELHGKVMAGTAPVARASVSLYAAGNSGYGSKATLLYVPGSDVSVLTDKNGAFTLPSGYGCPAANSQVYLVATGGTVGSNTSGNNALALMTALGSCNALSSKAVVVNEVTTIASAWALAPFAANHPWTGKSSFLYLGSSSSNAVGLANAFASVNNLVDITTGQARFWVPAGNAAAPYITLNTLADVLNSCTSTTGGVEGDGSACGSLLTNTDALSYQPSYNPTAPTDTLQAAFNIAQHPGSGGGFGYQLGAPSTFLSMVSLASPFQPILTAAPSDWALSLHFTGGGGLSSSSSANYFAIDVTGNLWITDSNAGTVVEWNNTGAAASSTGYAAGGGPIAVDASGNVWISGDTQLRELDSTGDAVQGSPFVGVSGGGIDMAFDASGYLWITNATGIAKFNSVGTVISPLKGYSLDGYSSIGSIAIDGSNNVRVAALSSSGYWGIADLFESSGDLETETSLTSLSQGGNQMAMDGAGNVWIPTGTLATQANLCKLPAYAGAGSSLFPTCYAGGPVSGTPGIGSIVQPEGIAVDGAGTLWIANKGGGYSNAAPYLTEVIPAQLSNYNYASFGSSSLAAGPLRVAVDNSGNVWVLLTDNTITEYVGVATPAVTPIAAAVAKNKLGVQP